MSIFDEGISAISEWTSHLSLEKIFSGDLSGVISLLYLGILIAIYSVLIYHFYRYVARRDCFKKREYKYSKLISTLKYLFLFPFIAVIFFLGFSLMLLFLAKDLNVDIVLSTAFAVILAIRITSYYTGDLPKDVAKMLPFALLGVFLVSPSFFEIKDITARVNKIPELINVALSFIIFIIITEWILRFILTVKHAVFKKIEVLPDK